MWDVNGQSCLNSTINAENNLQSALNDFVILIFLCSVYAVCYTTCIFSKFYQILSILYLASVLEWLFIN